MKYISGTHFWNVNVNYKKDFLGVEICTTSFKMPHLIHSLKAKTSPLNIGHWPQKENSSDSTFIDSQLLNVGKTSKNANANIPRQVFCVKGWILKNMTSWECILFGCAAHLPIRSHTTRLRPLSVIRRVVSPLIGVITPFTTGRGPPCKNIMILLLVTGILKVW